MCTKTEVKTYTRLQVIRISDFELLTVQFDCNWVSQNKDWSVHFDLDREKTKSKNHIEMLCSCIENIVTSTVSQYTAIFNFALLAWFVWSVFLCC